MKRHYYTLYSSILPLLLLCIIIPRTQEISHYRQYSGAALYHSMQTFFSRVATNITDIINTKVFINNVDMESDESIQKFVGRSQSFNEIGYVPQQLENIASQFVYDARGGRLQMRKVANKQLQALAQAFYEHFGKQLVTVSAYRSYTYQQSIKDRGCSDQRCAKAGHSEHQAGLGIDIFAASSYEARMKNPTYVAYYTRMKNNAHHYGFHNSYQRGPAIDGYVKEPWHWRYVGEELATYLHNNDLTFTEFYYKQKEERGIVQGT